MTNIPKVTLARPLANVKNIHEAHDNVQGKCAVHVEVYK